MKSQIDWLHLDNAAKIYPVLASERFTHVFRVSVTLNELINKEALELSVEKCRDRFPSFFVKLKQGLFWFYFEKNHAKIEINEEDAIICRKINMHQNKGYYFRVLYYHRRISIEMFHALSDGFGAIQLLKAITYQYLLITGKKLENDGSVFMPHELPSIIEVEDTYDKNFTKDTIVKPFIPNAYILSGKSLTGGGCSIINSKIETESLLRVAKSYQATLSQIIIAILIESIMIIGHHENMKKKLISICVPINLRPIFHSQTLRNFSLYFYTTYQFSGEVDSLEMIIKKVKNDFDRELKKEVIQHRLNSNVLISKRIYIRLIPLFIKKQIFKIAYYLYGKKPSTLTISNFGKIVLPASMEEHIDSFTFNLGSGLKPAIA